jgi:hypothetical protein
VVVTFKGSANLAQQLDQAGANVAHLVFQVSHLDNPADVTVQVFLNAPHAAADSEQGFVGAVAFFTHPGHSPAPFRLPLTAALKASPAQSGADQSVTFVPVPFPGRASAPQVLDVSATLHLVRSTVEPAK